MAKQRWRASVCWRTGKVTGIIHPAFFGPGQPMKSLRLLTTFVFSVGLLCAQTNRGGISGTVLDSSGAIVPGATVSIRNVGTNQITKETTSSGGTYAVLS